MKRREFHKTAAAVFIALAFSLTSCRENTNPPQLSAYDFDTMLDDIYSLLNFAIEGKDGGNAGNTHFLWSIAASDDALGGGGIGDPQFQAEDLLLNYGADMYDGFYVTCYKGIMRANTAIEALSLFDVAELNQYMGEVFFLRAWFYYELATMFGNIPCPLTTGATPYQVQVSGEALWGQILEDCKIAADIMPARQSSGDGHVDKYAAEALLGRAWLFATGFYGLSEVTLPAYENEAIGVHISEGTKLTKEEVGQYITDCVNNSGYTLVDDYHNLWAYTNRYSISDPKNPWYGKGYKWAGDDGARNPEAMFVIKFKPYSLWGATFVHFNQIALHMGVRGQAFDKGQTMPFGQGLGMCPVNPSFVEEWKAYEPNDARRDASILEVTRFADPYQYGDDSIQETGYYHTKNMPVVAWNDEKGRYDNYPYGGFNDLILIRFAEVLLMDAEINENMSSFDRVRARAGLPSRPLTVENLRNERRWELNFEGVRFEDMRRYGESYAVSALDKQEDVRVWNRGVEERNTAFRYNGGYGQRYKETKGFVTIPYSQVSLSTGAIKQNDGWGSQYDYIGWGNY